MAKKSQINRDLKRKITFEYTLIADVNDSDEEARGIARIAQPMGAKVNIIPYNPIQDMDFRTPSPERVDRFRKIFHEYGIRVTVRQTAGREIDAACGQLRLDREQTAGSPRAEQDAGAQDKAKRGAG